MLDYPAYLLSPGNDPTRSDDNAQSDDTKREA
ncbi:hypothetical protein CLV58_14419 [Spirosoma oryzae]|uniref:Uncharacterized protein n=1 Tax=Spirosoma oryzae TaxID=1469603 RepID=A0A2T0RNH2_9BACT|nr:hypothetical protein CLV58_14419 [Spirosoma oryzae]